jgi:hypothetical protein
VQFGVDGRNEVSEESYDELIPPEEVERDDCGDDVRREICWVDLLEEIFSLRGIVP